MPIPHRAVGSGNVIQFKGKAFEVIHGIVQGATDEELRQMIADGALAVDYPVELDIFVAAAPTTALANASPIGSRRMPFAGVIVGAFATVHGAPSTNTINIDVTLRGVSIFTTAMTIDVSEFSVKTAATPYVLKTGAPVLAYEDDALVANVTGSHSAATGFRCGVLVQRGLA